MRLFMATQLSYRNCMIILYLTNTLNFGIQHWPIKIPSLHTHPKKLGFIFYGFEEVHHHVRWEINYNLQNTFCVYIKWMYSLLLKCIMSDQTQKRIPKKPNCWHKIVSAKRNEVCESTHDCIAFKYILGDH